MAHLKMDNDMGTDKRAENLKQFDPQTFWILPELVSRTDAILSGNLKPASIHHMLYGILEITKLALVSLMSIKELCCLVKR